MLVLFFIVSVSSYHLDRPVHTHSFPTRRSSDLNSLSAQPYLFVDKAWVWNEDRLNARDVRQNLTSIGGGVRAIYGDKAQFDVALAVPLERAGLLMTEKPDVRLLVSLTTKIGRAHV